jgi:hypothetical protein
MKNPTAFVSYAGEDLAVAKPLAEGLMKNGIETFFAPWEILAGDNLVEKLNQGLSGAEFLVLLLSTHSLGKVWPRAEQDAATARMVEGMARVIPVNLGLSGRELPPFLQGIRWVSLSGLGEVEAAVESIAAAIYRRTERPPLGPIPAYAQSADLRLDLHPRLSLADRTVLKILFDLGKDRQFMADRDEYLTRAEEVGLSREALKDSLAMLTHQGMVSIEGAHELVTLYPWAVDECCTELVSEYETRKRRILAAAASGEWGLLTDQIREQCGEEEWLVCHVARWAEERGLLKLQMVNLGHECYSVYEVSPVLKRTLETLNTQEKESR